MIAPQKTRTGFVEPYLKKNYLAPKIEHFGSKTPKIVFLGDFS